MDSIFVIGDIHTVNAFRTAGVEGLVSDAETASNMLEGVLARNEVSLIIITRECAAVIEESIKKINLESAVVTVIEIPGIDDESGFGVSLLSFITEALGVAL